MLLYLLRLEHREDMVQAINQLPWEVEYHADNPRKLEITLHEVLSVDHSYARIVSAVKFSPDGKLLATGMNNVTIVWNLSIARQLFTFSNENTSTHSGDNYVRSLCFSPDGTKLAAGCEDKTIRIWNLATGQLETLLSGHQLEVYPVDYSSDGFLVSGAGDARIRIWDLPSNNLHPIVIILLNPPSNEEVTSVTFSPDGRLVAGAYLDGIARIWDRSMVTGAPTKELIGHNDAVYCVAFSPDGRGIFTASLDKTAKYWDLTEPAPTALTFDGHTDFVIRCSPSPDGKWLFTGSRDRTARVWDAKTGAAYATIKGHTNKPVISLDVSPSGEYLATGGEDTTKIWKITAV